ncbi:hypothetical protein [Nonomuraea sp. SYSU D8015]|uniref:hypothetical protein n=1 Tax=Nonomuraea sp. SYSU D8015 TaxID=2593644 RepID=UPI0016610601|nr:hypothetical protein [Nonomuraea sp. SYSU D8015]
MYDVPKGILLAEMAEVVKAADPQTRSAWLSSLLDDLCLHAAISDFHMPVDEWAGGHEEEFVCLVRAACERLRRRGRLTADEAAAWTVLDDLRVIWRGDPVLEVGPVVSFGEALVDIIRASIHRRRSAAGGTSACTETAARRRPSPCGSPGRLEPALVFGYVLPRTDYRMASISPYRTSRPDHSREHH